MSGFSQRSTTDFYKEDLTEIIMRTSEVHGVTESMLASPNRSRKLARIRAEITHETIYSSGVKLVEVAKRFHRAESVLCRAVNRFRCSGSLDNRVN